MQELIKTLFICIIYFLLSSCHEKDYDVIDEAKKFIFKDQKYKEKLKKEDINEVEKNNSEDNENVKVKKKVDVLNDDINKEELNLERNKVANKVDKKTTESDSVKSRVVKNIKAQEQTNLKDKDNNEKEQTNLNNIKKEINNVNIKNNSLKIGVMLPLSGKNKDIGGLILNAIELALFQDQKSNIELIIRDTQGHPEIAINAFKDIIDNNAAFIIGPLFSKTLAAIQDMTDANVINVFALTNNQNLAKKGVWVFGIDPQKQTEKALKFVLDNGHENIVALLPQNAYGLLLFESISDFAEDNFVNLKKIEFYEPSINSQQKAAKSLAKGFDKYEDYLNLVKKNSSNDEIEIVEKPFDSVFIAASGQTLTVLASELQYNNVDPKKIQYLGISSWEDDSILSEPALDGGVFVATTDTFQKNVSSIYRKSFNKDMPSIAMIAYDILALFSSIAKLKDNITIDDFLIEEGYLGLRGLFRLNEDGTVERSFDLKAIKKKKFIIYEKASSSWTN